jgi:8-oxo-dGTP diphosphatase
MTVDSFDWDHHTPTDRAVLCFIREDNRLLLIRKLRGLGKGKINGPGGRLETGETPPDAAVRETIEEVALKPTALTHAGELAFVFTDGYSLNCSVFTAAAYSGVPEDTEEARPFWCPVDRIPFDEMWADDRLWFPHMLAGLPFRGFFIFDDDRMMDHLLLTGGDAALSDQDLTAL